MKTAFLSYDEIATLRVLASALATIDKAMQIDPNKLSYHVAAILTNVAREPDHECKRFHLVSSIFESAYRQTANVEDDVAHARCGHFFHDILTSLMQATNEPAQQSHQTTAH